MGQGPNPYRVTGTIYFIAHINDMIVPGKGWFWTEEKDPQQYG
jgi:hypothetical protein